IYAKNIINEKIHIIDSDNNEKYYCVDCNDLLIPNKGQNLPWFYKHSSNNECDFEPNKGCVFYINQYSDCKSKINCDKKCKYKE
ncbi:MAG: hypothetical protein KBG30_13865, partial [Bacteroidales bacterium]|nr:hypothetical protein [Bacteroidales bacterium]